MSDVITGYQVWSSGLETWEDIFLPPDEASHVRYVHSKHVDRKLYLIYKDTTERWLRRLA